MKITKIPKEDPKKLAKQKALEECAICPYCGEIEEYFTVNKALKCFKNNISFNELYNGIECLGEFKRGTLFNMSYRVTCYKCHTCGTEYESDPYEV